MKKTTLCTYPADCEYCTKQLWCTFKQNCGYKVKTISQLAAWAVLLITSKIYIATKHYINKTERK